jgi:exosortase/archaeosortase family protein
MTLSQALAKPGFKNFIKQSVTFLALFIIYSYVVGQRTMSLGLLYKYYFALYGGLGYILLFSIVGFILLYRNKLIEIPKLPYSRLNLLFWILSPALLITFYSIEPFFVDKAANIFTVFTLQFIFLMTFATLVMAAFGIETIKYILKTFKKELIYFLIFGLIVYALMVPVWKLWPYLSLIVLKAVYFLLSLFSDSVRIIGEDILIYNGFSAKIAQACSGVYSIFLFTAIYLFIIFLDWEKLNIKRAAILFVPAVVGAFIVNILRVFILMVVGAHLSIEAALGLYHSYTGMILFLIYFVIFWFIFYPWLKKKK